ncbi:MAG TPA: hypothetical protein VNW97_20275 [Candidatus Saccharimonadales bacterium]|jgi:hypothetical protein|nr:hypothetical protein [Candidatus Saccharimonadales bacterium]
MKEYHTPFATLVGPAASCIQGGDNTGPDGGGDGFLPESPLVSKLEEE